jgi:aryl-alcohol dehydrogenase-like predicted oxidoreductase
LTGKYLDHIPEDSRAGQSARGKLYIQKYLDSPEGQQAARSVRALKPIAQSLDCSLAQLGLAWCLKNPHVSSVRSPARIQSSLHISRVNTVDCMQVITGASRVEQVHENVGALTLARKLNDDLLGQIDTILANRPPEDPDFRLR